MFVSECDSDEVKREASKFLKRLDVKHRVKKFEFKSNERKEGHGVFKVRLERLRQRKVKLQQYDQPIGVPAFLVDSCNYLRDRIETEGLFRKPGVVQRQKVLKQILMSGGRLTTDCEYNATDVADLLKQFFRELPEPCLPFVFHTMLERCMEIKERENEAVFLTLLLFPTDYLYTLAYLIQFLQEVASHHHTNRMDVNNLAIVWTPNLMPFKPGQVNNKQVLEKRLAIIQLLIENAKCVGVVPECLLEHLSWHPSCSVSSHDELESSRHREKKKKRSGSLTRMLSGIKKMVQRSGSEDQHQHLCVTPEQTGTTSHTPCIKSTGKKRKASESNLLGFSAKKSLTKGGLPEEAEPKRRSRFYTSKTPEWENRRKPHRSLSASKLRLSHFGFGKKHKKKPQVLEDSGLESSATPSTLNLSSSSDDFIRISRNEYEDIKSRVSRIESRISSEFDNIVGVSMSDLEMTPDRSSIGTVQSAYKKTLESAEKLSSPTTDELAKRFSKELNIRGSSEKRVIRSPSARKIGTMRRRSKENIPQVKRNHSTNISCRSDSRNQFYPSNILQRGKPNTVFNGLPEPLLMSADGLENHLGSYRNQSKSPRESLRMSLDPVEVDLTSFGVLTRSQARRASSFHGCDLSKIPNNALKGNELLPSKNVNNNTPINVTEWKTAEIFLQEENTEAKTVTGRPSVAKLRSQNAGMVLAKAKLFSTMVDSEIEQGRVCKSNKPSNSKCTELKKRNSSKSSKERKLQRKDSKNTMRRSKRENSVPKQSSEPNSYQPQKLGVNIVPSKGNVKAFNDKENMLKNQKLLEERSLPTNSTQASKILHNRFKENIVHSSTPGRHCSPVSSPLRERNRYNSPHSTPSRVQRTVSKNVVPGRSPKFISQTLKDVVSTPTTPSSFTPRRSPRQLLLKTRHLSKPL